MPRHSVKEQEAFTNTVSRNDVHVCHPELDSASRVSQREQLGNQAAKQLGRGLDETCHCEEQTKSATSQSQNVQNSTIMRLLLPSHKTILNRFARQSARNDGNIVPSPYGMLVRANDERSCARLYALCCGSKGEGAKEILKRVQDDRKAAFTLAEVLITLTIIGVVAAMTMPSLINNYKKKQTVTVLQREINVISNALKLSEVDNGEMTTWNFGGANIAENSKIFAENYFFPYLKTLKTCVPNSEECWTSPYSLSGELNSHTLGVTPERNVAAVLNDGTSILIWANAPVDTPHVQIFIDINGHKKGPNKLGKDIFGSEVEFQRDIGYKGNILLLGAPFSRDEIRTDRQYGCSKDVTGEWAGRYCGGLIQHDGWEIKDDYPW